MRTLLWRAPAKLNLFLHVTGRRDDGYHELQTVFQLIDAADDLRVTVRDDGAIRRTGAVAGLPEAADLTVRAARLLQAEARTGRGADIGLHKRLPMGGGLGGGSSDAGAVLLALNRLWGLGWGRERLAALGATLGADVAVFVGGRTAWGEGIGERLVPVALEPCWYVVATPPCHVSTAEIFGAPELTRSSAPLKIPRFFRDAEAVPVARLMAATRNDCEPVVTARYPEVAEALASLGAHGPARLTGTGASVFVALPARRRAEAVARTLPDRWRVMVARGLDRAPEPPADHDGV